MKRFTRILTTLAICSTSLLANAETSSSKNSFEITPHVGYRFGGDFETVDGETRYTTKLSEELNYGVVFAWQYDHKRQGEFLISHYGSEFSKTGGFDPEQPTVKNGIDVTYYHLGGNVPISDGAVPLWLSGGLGLTHLAPEDSYLESETKFSLNIGLNTKIFVTDNLAFNFGGRVYGTFFNSDSKVFCDTETCAIYVSGDLWVQSEVNAGITIAF